MQQKLGKDDAEVMQHFSKHRQGEAYNIKVTTFNPIYQQRAFLLNTVGACLIKRLPACYV